MLTLLNLLGANHFKKGTCAEQVKFGVIIQLGGGSELELIRLAWYAILCPDTRKNTFMVQNREKSRALFFFSSGGGGGGGGGGKRESLSLY